VQQIRQVLNFRKIISVLPERNDDRTYNYISLSHIIYISFTIITEYLEVMKEHIPMK